MKHSCYFYPLLFLHICSFTAFGQTAADSLKRLLAGHPQRDSVRCEWLYQWGRLSVKGSNPALRNCGKELLDIAEEAGLPLYQLRGYMLLGVSYSREGIDRSKALAAYEKGLEIVKAQRGAIWRRREAQVYMNITSVFLDGGRLDEALAYSRRSIAVLEALNDTLVLADNYKAYGMILTDSGKRDSALGYFRKAESLYRLVNETNQIAGLQCNASLIHLEKGDYVAALNAADYCWQNSDSARAPSQKLDAAVCQGKAHMALGNRRKAQACFFYALHAARRLNLSVAEETAYVDLSNLYRQWNKPDSALYYQDKYIEMNGRRLKMERDSRIQELETRFQVKEKEYENALLRSEKSLFEEQKTAMWWSVAAILMILAGIGRYLWQRWRRRMNEKTAELEAFNYSVSHDLRSPLQNARMWMEHLRADIAHKKEADIDADLGHISRSLDQLQDMLNGMLRWFVTESDAPYFSAFPVRPVVEEVWQHHLQSHEAAGIKFQAGDMPEVTADKVMLRLVFENLIGNAVKFTRDAPNPVIAVSCTQISGHWQFRVSDNGAGFDPDAGKQLFGLFKTAHHRDRFPGTGIGLALVKRLVEKMGGTVSAESAGPGQGAAFLFTLPQGSGGQ